MDKRIGSIYDLMEIYIANQNGKISPKSKTTLKMALIKLQDLGYCYTDVYNMICKSHNIDIHQIYKNIISSKTIKKDNVFNNVFKVDNYGKLSYNKVYHNELLMLPKASEVEYDIDTGVITHYDFEYFLEYKYSYTYDDLFDYYYSKKSLYNPYTIEKKRFINHFKDLVNRYKIEDVLWMIDASDCVLSTLSYKTLNTPYGIVDYYGLAQELKNRKKSENIANGCDCIVPRKRMLLS